MKKRSVLAAAAAVLAAASIARAEIRLPSVWSDHAVVQRDRSLTLWGWAGPSETVTVRFAGREVVARADAEGRFAAVLPAVKAGGGALELRVRGETGPEVVVRDILAGEVWLGSGQSNMEWPMASLASPLPEILRADHPKLRLYLVPKRTAAKPEEDIAAKWAVCSPESAAPFSAVAYYFGLELQERLGVPVGLIEAAWGGTRIEPWTPPAGFAAVPETRPALDDLEKRSAEYRDKLAAVLPDMEAWLKKAREAVAAGADVPLRPALPAHPFDDPQTPMALYNGMIHPLARYALRGAIWYQGESNRNDVGAYEKKMEALIRGWREVWGLGDFPFYYVQLAPYNYPYNRESSDGDAPDFLRLPLIWEAQTAALRIPNTGMAVVTDITALEDIHPRNKKDVGYRLALWARAKIYGETNLVCSGPLYKSMMVEGDAVRIAFDHAGSGLAANDRQPLRWFEIAGEDRIFYKAAAVIEGPTVLVRSPRVKAPAAVRFGWHQLAVPNLANKEGLPASPFRTDRW